MTNTGYIWTQPNWDWVSWSKHPNHVWNSSIIMDFWHRHNKEKEKHSKSNESTKSLKSKKINWVKNKNLKNRFKCIIKIYKILFDSLKDCLHLNIFSIFFFNFAHHRVYAIILKWHRNNWKKFDFFFFCKTDKKIYIETFLAHETKIRKYIILFLHDTNIRLKIMKTISGLRKIK